MVAISFDIGLKEKTIQGLNSGLTSALSAHGDRTRSGLREMGSAVGLLVAAGLLGGGLLVAAGLLEGAYIVSRGSAGPDSPARRRRTLTSRASTENDPPRHDTQAYPVDPSPNNVLPPQASEPPKVEPSPNTVSPRAAQAA
eukprot:CAMPEP_0118918776 /NCGR_PEP_ID=MMETSP1166-20130328/18136_1 /TAXON_ID=1104430 /ORGANISM="Chrysoreinhardia sp, Strain CCMP3193" /LENGTH=140 /DNA_ID=CAMNT_0006859155 /DNA_START=52 /DNA_END=474 /DNA_ORIENTATION=+